MKFKKISAIIASVLMAGATVGFAAAANYPAPFVDNGVADVAIVYGTGAGVSSLDMVQAGNIQTSLGSAMPATGTPTVTDGDSYLLEKTSTKYHLGDYAGDVVSTTLDDDELPTLLADGKFIDDDNDEFDFTQKILLNNASIRTQLFDDNDYATNDPTVGIRIANGLNVMNYTLDFTDEPLWADLATATLPLMGKDYYVLSVASANNSMTLLDSASDTILSEGETKTVDGRTVSIEFISTNDVKLNVDGEITNSLSETETFKLADGSYIGIKDISVQNYEGGIKQVEFSIGEGKLLLTTGSDVELNEDSISDLGVTITNGGSAGATQTVSSITIQWDADDDLFVTEDSEVIMPGFGAVKLSFAGLEYPEEETIMVDADGNNAIELSNFPLPDSTESIALAYFNGTNYTMVGKDSDNILRTSGGTTMTFDGDTDDWFVASWNDTQDFESYLMKVTNFKNESGTQKATFQYKKDGVWTDVKTDAEPADTITLGSVEFVATSLDKDAKTAVLTRSATGISFNTLYSKEGMRVDMPWLNNTLLNFTNATAYSAANAKLIAESLVATGQLGYTDKVIYYNETGSPTVITNATISYHPTTYSLVFTEEDNNDNLAAGDAITLTLSDEANNEASVETVSGYESGRHEIGDTDVSRSFVYSALATEILEDESTDQESVKLIYHAQEVEAQVYVTSADATLVSGGASALGDVLVKDSEVDSVSSNNLIIVGGSCINSAAATVLGGAYCGPAFTEATGVGAGQFLIQGVQDAYTTGKLALVVAGYEAADTVNAATYLTKKTVDTTETYTGTSATEATMVVTQ